MGDPMADVIRALGFQVTTTDSRAVTESDGLDRSNCHLGAAPLCVGSGRRSFCRPVTRGRPLAAEELTVLGVSTARSPSGRSAALGLVWAPCPLIERTWRATLARASARAARRPAC